MELENFRKKSAAMKSSRSEPGADSKEMSKILSHEEERSSAEISRQTPTKSTLVEQFLFLKSFKFGN